MSLSAPPNKHLLQPLDTVMLPESTIASYDLVVIVHLEGEDCLLCSVNPFAVSEHGVEFPYKDVPVDHDPRRWLLDKEAHRISLTG